MKKERQFGFKIADVINGSQHQIPDFVRTTLKKISGSSIEQMSGESCSQMLFQLYLMFRIHQKSLYQQGVQITYKDTTPSEIAGGATITENETANLGVGNGTALSHEAFPAGEEEQIKQLNNEVASLKEELQKKDSIMKSFLNNEQIAALQQTPNKWSAESTLLGLKLRFSQGVSIFYFTNC
ncbi:uncharacterized protein LOC120351386 isoform X1 [Nilaparvata lugens]|uniref:uncharacterized protein LOC120351386 isoform X1 n=1 Tax=Nilaparvata lugens TaxID=108931 RepID=UPI00193E24E6|nr:uncharacterized protein LOC120351386 isoform X1 [Nilaparvata lugens]